MDTPSTDYGAGTSAHHGLRREVAEDDMRWAGSTGRPPVRPRPEDVRLLGAIAIVTLLAMAAGFAVSQVRAPTYAATADVLISSVQSQPAQTMEREVATQAVVLASRTVLEPVAQDAGVPLDELSERVSVVNLRDTNVLRVRVEAASPTDALALTAAVVGRYLDGFSSGGDASSAVGERLEDELARLSNEMDVIQARLLQLDAARRSGATEGESSAEQVRLESRAALLNQRMASLQDRLLGAELDELQRSEPTVIAEATIVPGPVTPTLLQSVAAAGLSGLLLGGSLGMFLLLRRRRSDDTFPRTRGSR